MKQRRFILFLPAVFLLLLACRLSSVRLPGDTAVTNRSNTLVLLGSQPRTLDPAKTLAGPDGPIGHIFSGLVMLNPDLQIEPDLAAGWQVSDDGLVYTFYLRKNAVFHDGRPVLAEDVIASWERATDPATGSDTAATYLNDIEGVAEKLNGTAVTIRGLRAVDNHTLEVRLTRPVVYFLGKLAFPVAYVVDTTQTDQPNWERQPNGTGPFKLKRWVDDSILELTRFDLYYNTPAQIDGVVYQLGPGLPLAMYQQDEIDLVGIGGDNLAQALDPNNPLSAELQTAVSMCTSTIGLNNRLAPFDDVRVRQAFNYALDKELLARTFGNGMTIAAKGPLPPGMPGFNPDLTGYPYDPERARALLAEAGYADPADMPPLTYTTSGYGDVGPFVTAVITMWQQNLGVTIQPETIDPFAYYNELFSGNMGHFFDSGWCADYPDPQNFLDVLYQSGSQQNLSGYANAELDALLAEAAVETDVAERLRLYGRAEEMVIEGAPVVFLSHSVTAVLVKPRVQNYHLTPIGIPQWHRISLTTAAEK